MWTRIGVQSDYGLINTLARYAEGELRAQSRYGPGVVTLRTDSDVEPGPTVPEPGGQATHAVAADASDAFPPEAQDCRLDGTCFITSFLRHWYPCLGSVVLHVR